MKAVGILSPEFEYYLLSLVLRLTPMSCSSVLTNGFSLPSRKLIALSFQSRVLRQWHNRDAGSSRLRSKAFRELGTSSFRGRAMAALVVNFTVNIDSGTHA
jgi:hypothetical protein